VLRKARPVVFHSALRPQDSTLLSAEAPVAGAEIVQDQLPDLYRELGHLHMVPLWEIPPRLLPREPKPQAIPYL
jgi:hypothetical protein